MTEWEFMIREHGLCDVVTVQAKTLNKAYAALKVARPDYGEAHVMTLIDSGRIVLVAPMQKAIWR